STVGDVSFYEPWTAYKQGFGDLAGDYWLGNDAINELCPPVRQAMCLSVSV
ncbi:MAG: hypothetical protein GY770_27420, partial [Aestuariibacter sp.]|nr:hypothetical protein [Aestuariibacter sp.]